jgi:hypothetical protein
MFELTLKLIGLSCIGVLWINSEPTTKLRHWIYKSYTDNWHWRLINCCLCVSFWIGLIGTGDLLYAAIVSVLGEILCRKLGGGIL